MLLKITLQTFVEIFLRILEKSDSVRISGWSGPFDIFTFLEKDSTKTI